MQYESTSLIETLGTLREMLTIDEYQENLLITMKDIQNIVLEQTTLDLLIYLLKITDIFMNRPPLNNADQYQLHI